MGFKAVKSKKHERSKEELKKKKISGVIIKGFSKLHDSILIHLDSIFQRV